MTNYLALCALVGLAATAACADDKATPAKPATMKAAAAKPTAAAAAPATPPAARAKQFIQIPGAGSLAFTFIQAGAENHGSFKKFATELRYDEQNPAASSLRVTVQTASLDTQDKDRDSTLAGADLFDTQKFPTATYAVTSLAKRASGGFDAIGKLTLRGVTKDLRIPLTLTRTPNGYDLAGEVGIKRLDYGVGQGDWKSDEWVGNDVKLVYKVPLVEARAP